VTLRVSGPFANAVPSGDGNLVLRAARALAERGAKGSPLPATRLSLEKTLPIAAGLGGGSADAAAALRLLNRLWSRAEGFTPLDEAALLEIAMALGADVSACLIGVPLRARGIGEKIEPVGTLPPLHLVLANPGVPLSTAEVFRRRAGAFTASSRADAVYGSPPAADALSFARRLRQCANDLTAAARALEPLVARALTALDAAPSCLIARLSGSGATCFGLFAAREEAEAAAARIVRAEPAWWVKAAPVLARRPEPESMARS
jgi:4-diphosphocytidyl-2-C-methyl-D-erythritol kinase